MKFYHKLFIFSVLLSFVKHSFAADSASITYDLASVIKIAEGTSYRELRDELAKAFDVKHDQIELLVVDTKRFSKFYITSDLLNSGQQIPNDVLQAFASGAGSRLTVKR